MSAKSRERKEKQLAREQALQSSQNAPPPAAKEGEYIHPIMIHPIEYHNDPPPVADFPCQNTAAAAPMKPPVKTSVSMNDMIQSQFIRKPKPQEGFDVSCFVTEPERLQITNLTVQMQNAMIPRAANGTLLNNMDIGQVVQARIPVFDNPSNPTPDNPCPAIAYAEEFADGRVPEGFHYEDGFVTCVEGPDGKPMQATFFADPVRNLSSPDRAALELGRKMLQQNPVQQTLPNQDEDPLSEENDLDRPQEIGTVTDSPAKGCLTVITKKGMCRLTNFRIIPTESRLILGKLEREEPKLEYTFEILCGFIRKTITIGATELDNIVKVIQVNIPICTVTPTVLKASALISNYVREQIMDLPQKIYVQRTGFMRFSGAWVYVHDGATPPDPSIVFNTGRFIPDDRRVTDVQAFHNAMGFLDICSKDELIIPLFLLAHLGPLFQLFHEAGRTPRFVTVLAGRSGSLKTSLSLVLYRLFQDQGQTPSASFRDTETALEIKLGELNSSVGIFDDFAPPAADPLRNKSAREKLETIIRYVGDHVAKSRSNTKLGKAKEFTPSGCALVTAEDLSGSQSSLLRCLVLSISKGDIDGAKLRRFQNCPNLIPTHMARFLNFIGIHGDEIIGAIRNNYPNHLFEGKVTELRLVDTAAILMVTAQLLASYASTCGAMNEEQVHTFLERCYNAICSAIIASEAMTKEANPCTMYLSALFDLIEQGEIRLADNITFYNSESCCGYISAGYAWVDPHAAYAKIRQYYSRLNTVFPLSENQLNTHLADAELIEVTYEARNGAQKRLFTKKSSLPSRKRMMVIDLGRAQAYLEENGNN